MRMPICPNCGRERDARDVICPGCGYAGPPVGKMPAPPVVAVPDAFRPESGAAAPRRAVGPLRNIKHTTRNVLLGAVAIALVAAVMLIMRSRGGGAQVNAAAAATVPATSTRSQGEAPRPAVVPVAESASTVAPKWKRTRQLRWAADGSRMIGFEVEAERDVDVYMDRIRPILAVRCTSRATEVFVVLHSAASIENAGDTHAVKISLDGEPDVEQRWLDSTDMQALFAPDGKALADRLVASRRLRFSFKPFNHAPATVEFDVHGFDEPLAAMSKTCAPASKSKRAGTARSAAPDGL